MRPVKIVTDSCSDIPKILREQYDIDYMLCNTVRDNKETPANLDWELYSPKEFYDILRSGERVTTTMVIPTEFKRYFRTEVEKGNDIVYIACSSKLSGSVNAGKVEAEAVLKDFPDATICCVDSLNACLGETVVAIKAAELRDAGKSAKEIEKELLPMRNNVNQFVTVDTLNALKAAGRVTGSSAYFGNLLGVKPIIISDKSGNNTPIKKVKGRLNSLKEIVALMAEGVKDIEDPVVYIAHADCEEDAKDTEEMLKEAIPGVKTVITYIGPIIGASIGAGAIGVFAYGKSIERFGV